MNCKLPVILVERHADLDDLLELLEVVADCVGVLRFLRVVVAGDRCGCDMIGNW